MDIFFIKSRIYRRHSGGHYCVHSALKSPGWIKYQWKQFTANLTMEKWNKNAVLLHFKALLGLQPDSQLSPVMPSLYPVTEGTGLLMTCAFIVIVLLYKIIKRSILCQCVVS